MTTRTDLATTFADAAAAATGALPTAPVADIPTVLRPALDARAAFFASDDADDAVTDAVVTTSISLVATTLRQLTTSDFDLDFFDALEAFTGLRHDTLELPTSDSDSVLAGLGFEARLAGALETGLEVDANTFTELAQDLSASPTLSSLMTALAGLMTGTTTTMVLPGPLAWFVMARADGPAPARAAHKIEVWHDTTTWNEGFENARAPYVSFGVDTDADLKAVEDLVEARFGLMAVPDSDRTFATRVTSGSVEVKRKLTSDDLPALAVLLSAWKGL